MLHGVLYLHSLFSRGGSLEICWEGQGSWEDGEIVYKAIALGFVLHNMFFKCTVSPPLHRIILSLQKFLFLQSEKLIVAPIQVICDWAVGSSLYCWCWSDRCLPGPRVRCSGGVLTAGELFTLQFGCFLFLLL